MLPWLIGLSLALGAFARPPSEAPSADARAPAVSAATPRPSHLAAKLHREVQAMEPWLARYGAGAVFGAVFVEGVGVPAPGLTLLVAGAVLSAGGRGPPVGLLLVSAFAAAALGNSLGYAVGRFGGRALLRRLRVSDQRLEPLARGFAKYGGWFIVLARFFDGLKQLNGLAAGALGMPWRAFSAFNLVGAGLWVGFFGLGTYYVDEHLQGVRALLRHVNPWVAAGASAGALLIGLRYLGSRRNAVGPPE